MKFRYQILFLILYFLVLMFPYLYDIPHIFTNLHDNLEIDMIRYILLSKNNAFFKPNDYIIPEMMCGLPRLSFDSEFYYVPWLFYFFSPYQAYVINILIIHFVGFWSMYIFGKYLVNKNNDWVLFTGLTILSGTFSYLQEQHSLNLGLSIASSPFLLYSFLNIKNHTDKIYHWIFVGIYPFVSRLTHVGFFWIVLFLSIMIYWYFIKNFFSKRILLFILILITGYVIVEYRLFKVFLFDSYVSHRVEFNHQIYELKKVLLNAVKSMLFGNYQAQHIGFILLILLSIMVAIKKIQRIHLKLFILILGLNLIGNIYHYNGIRSIIVNLGFLNGFDLSRFLFITPVWVFYLICLLYSKTEKLLKILFTIVMFFGFMFSLRHNHTAKDTYKKILHFGKPEVNSHEYFYLDEFYATKLFDKIKQDINMPLNTFRVASIGLHPAVSLFNGFYTIDGAIANYPLEYKKLFRKIIAKELDKNKNLKRYFDEYGCRAYLFLGDFFNLPDCIKRCHLSTKTCSLNTGELKKLNCRYIFSTIKIQNLQELQWKYFNTYSDKNYTIYVYRIFN